MNSNGVNVNVELVFLCVCMCATEDWGQYILWYLLMDVNSFLMAEPSGSTTCCRRQMSQRYTTCINTHTHTQTGKNTQLVHYMKRLLHSALHSSTKMLAVSKNYNGSVFEQLKSLKIKSTENLHNIYSSHQNHVVTKSYFKGTSRATCLIQTS